jgi:hypothetical protein
MILIGPLDVVGWIIILADPTGGFIDEIKQTIEPNC